MFIEGPIDDPSAAKKKKSYSDYRSILDTYISKQSSSPLHTRKKNLRIIFWNCI